MRKTFIVLAVALCLLGIGASVVAAQTGMGWFLVEDDLWVNDQLRVEGTAQFDSAATFDGATTIDTMRPSPTALTATNGLTITPASSYYVLSAAGEVTVTLETGTQGDLLFVTNSSNQTINIADSGNVASSGATALGQYDSILFIFDGTYWIELGQANN